MGCTLVIDTSFGSTVGIVGREPIVETDSRTHVEKLQVNIARAVEEARIEISDVIDELRLLKRTLGWSASSSPLPVAPPRSLSDVTSITEAAVGTSASRSS